MVAAVALIALAAVAAAALVLERPRAKAWAVLATAALVPVALVLHRWGADDGRWLRDHPVVLAAGLAGVAAAVAGLAVLVARRPDALPVLVVAVLPFRLGVSGAAGAGPEALALPLYAVVVAGALAYAAARLRPVRSLDDELFARPDPPTRGLEWALAAALVLYAVQATAAADRVPAVGTTVTALVPFALLFVLLRRAPWTPALVRRCAAALVAVAVVLVAVAAAEARTGRLLPAPRAVTDDRLTDAFRASSLVFDPDALGRLLAVTALLVVAGLLWERRGRTLALGGALLVVLWGGLVLTRSPAGALALLAGLVLLAALRWGVATALGLGATLAVAGVAAVLLGSGSLRLGHDAAGAADRATSGRAALLRDGVDLALERPAAGWGAGAAVPVLRRSPGTSLPRARAAARTEPLTIAVEQGALGLAAWLAVLWFAGRRLVTGARGSPARAALAAALVALVVHALLHAILLEDPMTWALLGAGSALAFADRRHRPRRRAPGAEPVPAREARVATPA